MKILLKAWILSSFLFSSSSPQFNLKDCDDCQSIFLNSAFWLSQSPIINPLNRGIIFLQYGLTSINMNAEKKNTYPNLNISFKITKNLSITSKIFGFQSEDDLPQVLGAGFQYYFGTNDTLNTLVSIQRSDLKGLDDFKLNSINVDLKKWLIWKKNKFRYGIGSMFYKSKISHKFQSIGLKKSDQINYLELECLRSVLMVDLGFGFKTNSEVRSFTLIAQKEIL
jgi:hypothetical protein